MGMAVGVRERTGNGKGREWERQPTLERGRGIGMKRGEHRMGMAEPGMVEPEMAEPEMAEQEWQATLAALISSRDNTDLFDKLIDLCHIDNAQPV
jgi:hypothetical protein